MQHDNVLNLSQTCVESCIVKSYNLLMDLFKEQRFEELTIWFKYVCLVDFLDLENV